MRLELATEYPLTDESIKAATGRTWEEWFTHLDAQGGPALGRRAIGVHLFQECKVDAWWVSMIQHRYEAARGVVEKDGRAKGFNVCSSKTIAAPLEAIYAAWASPAALRGWYAPAVEGEVAVKSSVQSSEGDALTFTRVRPNKDLRFTWDRADCTPGSIVDVAFIDKGKGKVTVQVTHDRVQTPEEAEAVRRGWAEVLSRLKDHLEG